MEFFINLQLFADEKKSHPKKEGCAGEGKHPPEQGTWFRPGAYRMFRSAVYLCGLHYGHLKG